MVGNAIYFMWGAGAGYIPRQAISRKFSPFRMRAMKRLKDVSLFAALCVALISVAIAASPSIEAGCQAQSSAIHLSNGEAASPIGPVLFGSNVGCTSFELGSEQLSGPCDSGGDPTHAHGCHSQALSNVSASVLALCSPTPSRIANELPPTGGTVRPPAEPPRIPA